MTKRVYLPSLREKKTSIALRNSDNTPSKDIEKGRAIFNLALRSLFAGYLPTPDCDRDMDKEFKYPQKPYTVWTYKWWIQYNGIAKRANNIFPEETWESTPVVRDNKNIAQSEFDKKVEEQTTLHNVNTHLQKLDIVRGIGEFGILYIGYDDIDGDKINTDTPAARLDRHNRILGPAVKGTQILFMRAFDQAQVKIVEWDDDHSSVRYGQPVKYQVLFSSWELDQHIGHGTLEPDWSKAKEIHWTRVIHSAEGETDIVASPRLESILEYIHDIKKVGGGAAEMFWRAAMPGYSFETQEGLLKDGFNIKIDTDSIQEQIKLFSDGLQRFVATVGMTAKSLAPQVTEPNAHVDLYIKKICIAIRVPVPIFIGAEEGHLAGNANRHVWNGRLASRRTRDCTPTIVIPFWQRMVEMNIVPKPKNGQIHVEWPDPTTKSEADCADTTLKFIQALAQYMTAGCAKIMDPVTLLIEMYGWAEEKANDIVAKAKVWMRENKDFLPPDPAPVKNVGGNQTGNAKKKKLGRPKGKQEKVK